MTFQPKSNYSKPELVDCAAGKLFGPTNGKLPSNEMLMFDNIEIINDSEGKYGKGLVHASLDINPKLWFFDCHFTNDPVMPGCLGLDAMWQLVGFYLLWLKLEGYGRALGVEKVKFFGQVLPNAKKVSYEIHIKRVVKRSAIVGFGDGGMYVDGKHIYSANNLRVGLFKDLTAF